MPSFEEAARQAYIEKKRRELEAARPRRRSLGERIGGPADFGQGAFRGVANIMPAVQDVAAMSGVGEGGDQTRMALEASPLLQRPDSFMGRAGERFGSAVPMMAVGGPVQSTRQLAAMVASEVAAAGAGQAAEDAGLGGGFQFLTEMGVSAVNPMSAVGRFAPSRRTRISKEIKQLADRLGVSEKAILRAGEFHRENDLSVDPFTGEPDVAGAVRSMEEAVALFPDRRVRPSTRQATGKVEEDQLFDGEPGLADRETRMAGADRDFRNRLAGRKRKVMQSIEREFDLLRPGGSSGVISQSFENIVETANENVSRLWGRVDLDAIPMVETRRLKAAAQQVRDQVGPDYVENLPPEIAKIEALPDLIPASRLQKLRSQALREFRIRSRSVGEGRGLSQAQNMGPVLRAMTEEVNRLPREGSRAYREALAATRKFHEMFDGKSVAVDAMSSRSEARDIARKIRGSARPAEEVKKARRILEQTPGGLEAFQEAVIEELVDDSLGNRSIGAMTRDLRRNAKFYREALGPERYENVRKVMKKLRMAQTGSAATARASEKTQSARNPVGFLTAIGGAMQGRAGSASELGEVVGQARNFIENRMLYRDVIREFMLDPESAIIILQAPDKKTLPVWTATFDMLMARALSRKALAAEVAGVVRATLPDSRDFQQSQQQETNGQQARVGVR